MNAMKQNEALNAVKQAREAGMITADSEKNITRWLTESQFEAYVDALVGYISQVAWKELDDYWTRTHMPKQKVSQIRL